MTVRFGDRVRIDILDELDLNVVYPVNTVLCTTRLTLPPAVYSIVSLLQDSVRVCQQQIVGIALRFIILLEALLDRPVSIRFDPEHVVGVVRRVGM